MGCLSKNYKKIINLGSWESNCSNDKFHFLYQGCYIVLALFIECSANRIFFTVHDKRHDFKFSSVYILVHFFFLSRHGIFVSVIFWGYCNSWSSVIFTDIQYDFCIKLMLDYSTLLFSYVILFHNLFISTRRLCQRFFRGVVWLWQNMLPFPSS